MHRESTEVVKVITGPTGSGKSALALKLCEREGVTYVNCDVFQMYRELPILSAVPDISPAVKTEFLSQFDLTQRISAGEFGRLMLTRLQKKHREQTTTKEVWVGTGLYLGAALFGLDEDQRKGTPFQGEARVSFRMQVLDPPRDHLYAACNRRVDEMIEKGGVEEARKIFERVQGGELSRAHPILKAIGLQHLLVHFEGLTTWERCVELWKRDTRRLAKRQWTWLRKFCPASDRAEWVSL